MKSAIIYYSYTGNTRKIALDLRNYLTKQGSVELMELKALDESRSFFGQVRRALFRKEAEIEDTEFDLSRFDLICLGTPVWAFGPAPAMNTFLKKCFGPENKTVVIFTTYGSGTGNGRCIQIIQNLLKQKGVRDFHSFSIQQFKVKDNDFILHTFNRVL